MTDTPQNSKPSRPDANLRPLLSSALAISRDLFKVYPWSLSAAVALILISGLLEGIGLVALLPLLDMLTGEVEEAGKITRFFATAFAYVGLPMTTMSVVSVMIAVICTKAALLYCAEIFAGGTIARMTSDFRLGLIRGLSMIRWPFFSSEPIGKLSNAITLEPVNSAAAARGLIDFTSVSIQAAVYLCVALLLSWEFTLAGILAGSLMAAILNLFVRISRREGVRQSILMRSYTSRIVDWLNGIKAIKAMGLESRIEAFLERETHELMRVQKRLVFANAGLKQLQEPIAAIFAGVGLIVAIEVFAIPTNALLVMVAVFLRAIGRIGAIQKSIKKFASNEGYYLAYQDNMLRVANEAETVDRPRSGGQPAPAVFQDSIELKSVGYAYGSGMVIDGITLTIKAGTLTSLVGPSGSGKSTLLDLIAGLLKPQAGAVLVDGVDLKTMVLRDWRQQIGYVPQETILLHASVRENLTLGDPAITDADLAEALEAADATDFVAALSDGLDTMVGERGLKVSGGQRQRLAVARALVRRPKLLLLDEATSALDQESEQILCQRLAELVPPLTIVAISHRPAVEAVADVTYRLEGGHLTRCEPSVLAPGSSAQGASV